MHKRNSAEEFSDLIKAAEVELYDLEINRIIKFSKKWSEGLGNLFGTLPKFDWENESD